MCNPAGAAAGAAFGPAAFLAAGGTGLQVIGQLQQGQQQKALADFEARQLEADASAVAGQASVNADLIRKAGRRQRSTARAMLAKGGVVADAGSGSDVQSYIIEQSELDAIAEMMTGRRSAERMRVQAEMSRVAGRNAVKNSQFAAAGSFLDGGAKVASLMGRR